MSNPLTKVEDYLDEVVRIFVLQAYSTKYEAPILYFLKELESQASRQSNFSKNEFNQSLEMVKDKISDRLEQGLWK
jgi:hypothetical protein